MELFREVDDRIFRYEVCVETELTCFFVLRKALVLALSLRGSTSHGPSGSWSVVLLTDEVPAQLCEGVAFLEDCSTCPVKAAQGHPEPIRALTSEPLGPDPSL